MFELKMFDHNNMFHKTLSDNKTRFDRKTILRRKPCTHSFAFVVLLGLLCAAAYAQPRSQPEMAQSSSTETASRVSRRPPDIISDNLDKAAASADQILEIVNKEAGLMVEFKRLLAREAGVGGQIVEESDLSDDAVEERLRSDLRARVLATRLLQRYGYLVPRLNPDSDLEAEQKLVRQERAQMLARAAERRDSRTEDSRPGRNAACDLGSVAECAPASALPEHPESRTLVPLAPRPESGSGPVQRTEDNSPSLMGSPEGTGSSPEQRPEYPSSRSTPGTVLAAQVDANPAMSRTSPRGRYGAGESYSSPPGTPADAASLSDFDPFSSTAGISRTAKRPERHPPGGDSGPENMQGNIRDEQGRMVRQPNPYAEVPSLYDLYVQARTSDRPLERFGLEIFRKEAANPDYIPMDLPVGPSYVVGPGDSLSIDLWGGASQRLLRTVDREGRVALPEAGPVLVSGRTLGDVQEIVQRTLRRQFRDVSADVALLRLRSVRMYVVGEVRAPGAYDVSSLSTPLNALFVAGGVTAQGSLRRLQHYRGKQMLEEVDAYDLLLHGIRGDLARIENGDSLLVPALGAVVKVEGMVRRPAIYELREEKTLLDVLDLAGGILPAAALRHIEVERLVAHEKRTMLSVEIGDASDSEAVRAEMRGFAVQDGDEIHIFPIAPYNSESIYLIGHVLRPGKYSYKPAMTLSDLLTSYADLLPEPSTRYAEIIRLQPPDYRPVVESFDLAAAFAHPEQAPQLKPLDTVHIFGRYDFEPDPEVLITGEVRDPGSYRTSGQQHLRDAIFRAGGVTPDAWLDSAQLFRRQPDGTTRVLSINLSDALAGDPLHNVLVEPRDRILVHRQPEAVSPPSVYVRGEVARPGRYPLAANMMVSDLIRSAGGLLRSANPEGGDLTHYALSNASGERAPAGHRDINLAAALGGKDDQNLALRDGDVLTVPQQAGWSDVGATVTLRGEVRKPGVYGIRSGERLSALLQRAGGLLPTAYPRAAVFERAEVRDLQQKSRQELIQRLEQESTVVKTSASTSGSEEAALQQAAVLQRERVLAALRKAPVSGRLVIHLRPDRKNFAGSSDDIELRAGDSLIIPKQPGVVLVIGQVYNANALIYTPGRNAGWYFSRAGGATNMANKGAIFIVRADGSVTGRNEGGLWSGKVLSAAIGPGDTIVVPERSVVGSSTLKNVLAVAQIASSAALVAAVAIP
jgi:polysaccharide biosynthesis/export protein